MRAALLAVVVATLLPPGASGAERPLSPTSALEGLPRLPASPSKVHSWFEAGADREVAALRQHAERQFAEATRETRAMGRDLAPSRRAAVQRIDAEEAVALYEIEQALAGEAALAREVEQLVRAPRADLEREEAALESARQARLKDCADDACRARVDLASLTAHRDLLQRHLAEAEIHWELLRLRASAILSQRQRLAERVATASSDPFLVTRAKALLAGSWKAVAELAGEVERESSLAARWAAM